MSKNNKRKKTIVIEENKIDLDEPKKQRKKGNKKKKSFKSFIIKRLLVVIFLLLIICAVYLGFKAYNFRKLAFEMFNNSPSSILDSNNNVIAEIGIERNRQNIDYDDIPSKLIDAYISIEDQRYFKHHGVDIKRTGGAILNYVIKRGSSSFGGSTITQQLVKNLTGNDSNSISRKVKEWYYAYVLNFSFSKNQIIESYLNIIYTGPNIYGVQEAALYYFNKDVKDLSLAECSYLAGLNNSPNSYNPFSEKNNQEKIKKRCKTVLKKMKELEYITSKDYEDAILEVDNGLKFNKGDIQKNKSNYSYHVDALINEIILDLSKKYHITKTFAENYYSLAGCKIYSNVNLEIQKELEKEFESKKYILKSANGTDTSQAAMVVIEHSTGKVVGCVGGLGEKKSSRSFNRVTQMKRQTGSAMKPIAVLVPALSKKIVTNVTIIADEPTTFTDYNGKPYSPIDYDPYKGSITLRQAVESSQNIPFVKIMEDLTPQVSIKYLKNMGITTLNQNDANLALSLGGLDEGISPLEFAGAYSCIANDGVYIEPTFYSKINSNSGVLFIKSKQKTRKVFSKDVACIVKQLLLEPVKRNLSVLLHIAIFLDKMLLQKQALQMRIMIDGFVDLQIITHLFVGMDLIFQNL